MFATEHVISPPTPVESHHRTPRLGSIESPLDRLEAITKILGGGVVAFQAPGTGGLLHDPFNQDAACAINEIKAGMRRIHNPTAPEIFKTKTTSLLITLEQLAPIVDTDKLSPKIKNLLWGKKASSGINFKEFAKIGGLFFLKLPIYDDARVDGLELPPWTYSIDSNMVKYIHVICLDADPAIGKLMEEVRAKGVPFLGVTSMNYSDHPEIVDLQKQKMYAIENDLYFLEHPAAAIQNNQGFSGSYTIVNEHGKIVRMGTASPQIIGDILGNNIVKWDETTPRPKYPALEMDPKIVKKQFIHLSFMRKVAFMKRYAILKGEGKTAFEIRKVLAMEF